MQWELNVVDCVDHVRDEGQFQALCRTKIANRIGKERICPSVSAVITVITVIIVESIITPALLEALLIVSDIHIHSTNCGLVPPDFATVLYHIA